MALQITTNINVDFYDNEYIMLNAKQYDGNSRYITITCYDNGKLFNLNKNKHVTYIRYRKSDGYGGLNSCQIDYKGAVLIELTEQILATTGICDVDLIIVDKDNAKVEIDVDTGEIITIDGSSILSTMTFHINVYEAALDNSVIESSPDFSALGALLNKANTDYTDVIRLAKSYAVGDASDARVDEDIDNSKYYYQMSRSYAVGDNDMREDEGNDNAEYYSRLAKSYAMGDFDGSTDTRDEESTENAKTYMEEAKEHRDIIEGRIGEAEEFANKASEYAKTTEGYMSTTKGYMDKANESKEAAARSESNAIVSMNTTLSYMNDASIHASDAARSAASASIIYENVAAQVNGAFQPMGTIPYDELANLKDSGEVKAGYLYHISDAFWTDDTFKTPNVACEVGTNVYYTGDGYWDVLVSHDMIIASADEVIRYLGI